MVTEQSARGSWPLRSISVVLGANHIDIVKPESPESLSFLILKKFLNEIVDETQDHAPETNTLESLTVKYPTLRLAKAEIETTGISNAVAASVLGSNIPLSALSEFYLLIAKHVTSTQLCDVAVRALEAVDKFNVGHAAVEYCLEEGRLEPEGLNSVARRMETVVNEPAVLWCHKQMIENLKTDDPYYSFLRKHIETIVLKDVDNMMAYLLYPSRGPSACNIFSFALAIEKVQDPKPLVMRWVEWIDNGKFDGNARQTAKRHKLSIRL